MTEKDAAFIHFLVEGTQTGRVRWEPTVVKNEFVTTLKGKYIITLKQQGSTRYMLLRDSEENLLLSVTSDDNESVLDLFDAARRVALDVDSAIDEILAG